jgi:uncharacterized low-complexity protein
MDYEGFRAAHKDTHRAVGSRLIHMHELNKLSVISNAGKPRAFLLMRRRKRDRAIAIDFLGNEGARDIETLRTLVSRVVRLADGEGRCVEAKVGADDVATADMYRAEGFCVTKHPVNRWNRRNKLQRTRKRNLVLRATHTPPLPAVADA